MSHIPQKHIPILVTSIPPPSYMLTLARRFNICEWDEHFPFVQQLIFAEAIEEIAAPPDNLPACPNSCTANFAGWALDYVAAMFGDSGFM